MQRFFTTVLCLPVQLLCMHCISSDMKVLQVPGFLSQIEKVSSDLNLPKYLRNFSQVHVVNSIEKHSKNCPVLRLWILN